MALRRLIRWVLKSFKGMDIPLVPRNGCEPPAWTRGRHSL